MVCLYKFKYNQEAKQNSHCNATTTMLHCVADVLLVVFLTNVTLCAKAKMFSFELETYQRTFYQSPTCLLANSKWDFIPLTTLP